jgi:hypothetical protein
MQKVAFAVVTVIALYVVLFGVSGAMPDDPVPDPSHYSSLVTALASSGPDSYLNGRPVMLGGVGGNTGDQNEGITFGSLEESSD